MIDNDLWIGVFLIDAPAAARKTFRANVRVIGLEYASDLAATAYTGLESLTRDRVRARTIGKDEGVCVCSNDARVTCVQNMAFTKMR